MNIMDKIAKMGTKTSQFGGTKLLTDREIFLLDRFTLTRKENVNL